MSKEFSPEEYQVWLSKQPKKMIVVKTIIKSESGSILLAKPTYKKTWQLPGGGVDSGENPEDAVAREVNEELSLGIDKQALNIVGTIYKEDDDLLILIYEYSNTVDENTHFELPSDEIEGYEFVEQHILNDRLPGYYSGFLSAYVGK